MTHDFEVENQSRVIVLKLRGAVAGAKVTRPITVKTSAKCTTCGRQNRSNAQFCSNCGTALVII
jgi:rRNA maturation endonuclease Nob1